MRSQRAPSARELLSLGTPGGALNWGNRIGGERDCAGRPPGAQLEGSGRRRRAARGRRRGQQQRQREQAMEEQGGGWAVVGGKKSLLRAEEVEGGGREGARARARASQAGVRGAARVACV